MFKNNFNHEIKPNDISPSTKKDIALRILIAVILILIVAPCILIGDYIFFLLIFVFTIISTHEIIKAPQSIEKRFNSIIYIFAYLMMIILVYYGLGKSFLSNPITKKTIGEAFSYHLYTGFNNPSISLGGFIICMAFFFLNVLIDKNFTIHDAFYFISMLFIVSIGFQSALFIRYYPLTSVDNEITKLIAQNSEGNKALIESLTSYLNDPWFQYGESTCLFFYFAIASLMTDAGAYFVGVFFGKHQLAPRISPHKTVEGFIGGIVFSIIFSLGFAFPLIFTNHPLVYGVLDSEHWYFVLILSLIIPFISSFGDLLFSSVKRGYNIKDFGRIFKNHGGALDRIDSLLITAVAIGLIIPLFAKLVEFL